MEAIAAERNLTSRTVINHLAELIEMDQSVDLNQLVISVRQEVILQAIDSLATESLKVIYEHLEESYSYEEIQLVRAWWRQKNKR